MVSRNGMTFIELVIVVLILGIVAAVAAPRYVASLEYFRVEAAARRIAADLELARRNARSTGNSCTVQFDVALNQYTLVAIKDINHPVIESVTNLSKTGYPTTLIAVDFNGSDRVVFDLYGRPLAGSPLVPLTAGALVVRTGGRERTIVVDPTTGKAQIR